MSHQIQSFLMHSLDDLVVAVQVQTSTGGILNLTGASFVWTLHNEINTPVLVTKNGTTATTASKITDTTGGLADIVLVPADTATLRGVYYHKMVVTDLNSKDSNVLDGYVTID